MSSRGVVQLADVKEMLRHCAPNHTFQTREHNHVVRYEGRAFPSLPLGKHGARKNPEIKAGHVRQMIRELRIAPGGAGYDRNGFPQRAFTNLKSRLERLGARRIWRENAWYWDLKPDYTPVAQHVLTT